MVERVENVSTRGAHLRKRNGWISVAVAAGVAIALVVLNPPRFYRAVLGIPVALAAVNFFEAREKT